MENNNSFSYTYSAQEQKEIEHIRKKYLPKEEDKMEQLRRLHYSASRKAQAASIAIGTVGALVLGTGMSLCMTDLAVSMGHMALVLGIIVGLVGLVMVALAYPMYNKILKAERARIAPEILRLTDELMK